MGDTNRLTRRTFLGRAAVLGAAGLAAARLGPSSAPAAAAPPPAGGWQIGCYTRPWSDHDYRVAFDAVAKAGYKHVGLMTAKSATGLVISVATTPDEARQVGDEAAKRGLAIPSVYAGDFPVAESLEAGIRGLKRLIDHCAAARAANLMVGGTGDPKLQEAYYKAVAECCDYAAGKGIGISVKPHGGLNGTGPQCRKTIEAVGHANFRLWYDPGNIFYYSDGGLNPVDDAATVDGLVVGMSVKDYRHPKNVDVTPGSGQVDFASVLARLKKGGFARGPLVVETLARGDLAQTLAQAKQARECLERLTRPAA
ncbi:MAG: sugar phosphate isomerase/epimerase [Planctomycetes bacterium]|nr:sugar phosphate isomerase/epimerase [Planctomycetota bacterium]